MTRPILTVSQHDFPDMKDLIEYVREHTVIPPESGQPCADQVFFSVGARNQPDASKLKELVQNNKKGEFCDVDLFDGGEHNYIEIGAWIGDQGLALTLMGLGTLLGLWKSLTPKTVLGTLPKELETRMAQQGFVSIQV